ncbi:hypothetical protein GGQ72_004529, partial [Rhizobium rhizoryzae]|nr:hypothetical protein [Rhizobium rhizoryzae]
QRARTNNGGGIIEAEIHLAKRPKLFRQTEPPLFLYKRTIDYSLPRASRLFR